MNEQLQRGFRIGAFEVEPLAGRISGPEGTQHVQPKVMDVLVCLAEEHGALVERDALLDRVWRRVTSEEVLTRCISELRRALGDDRGNPRYIQTVPKRGYRLVEPVILATQAPTPGSGAGEVRADAPPAQTAQRRGVDEDPPSLGSAVASVAVLPFDCHSADAAHAFMGDAFAAELHTTLARVDRLRVVSRRSSFLLKNMSLDTREIGARLGVDYVISGSLQCNGTKLRVVAELDDANDGTQAWAQSYDRNSEDLLSVEREVAEAIVASFTTQQLRDQIRRARSAPPSSLDAWGLVQRARACVLEYTPEGLAKAIEPLKQAIEIDANYPAAHATLGSLLTERLVNGLSENRESDERLACESAKIALTLAPDDPFILKMIGLVWTFCGDHRRALNCLRKAVAYTPFDFGAWGYMGWPLTARGDPADLEELQRILRRLLSMEPQHPGAAFWLYHRSVAEACEGRYEAAADSAEAAVDLRPSLALALIHYANVLGHCGRRKAAEEALRRCSEANPAMTPTHFAWLIRRMSDEPRYLESRLGGLRKIGELEGVTVQ